jgi:hypothetical protein
MNTFSLIALVVVTFGILLYMRAYLRAVRRQTENKKAIESARAYAADFTTPEGAILCLENAYRQQDLPTAVACKDFAIEARLMLQKLGSDMERDDEIVAKTAEVLELSFRKHTTAAWPDFSGLESFFVAREPYAKGVVVVTEICRYPDGGTSRQKVLVAETEKGWRVLNPV